MSFKKSITEEHRRNLSISHKGQKAWNKGKKLSEDHCAKLALAKTGKKLSEEHLVNISGENNHNYGKSRAVETRKKISESVKLSYERKPELKIKRRQERVKSIEKNHGIAIPGYNLDACYYFYLFDSYYNTKGRYAVYGGGEFLIEELGYYPDYINFEKKLIMEWDEEYLHYKNGKLSERDVKRQQEIQDVYPDFEFRRLK